MKKQPIEKGNFFHDGRYTWQVIRVVPRGKADLYCAEIPTLITLYPREVLKWQRTDGVS